ncbi:MAG TPA: cyclic nucleotide-binding domain-containing protein [Myxococcota bacterium]|nr:cyclic nucleotide-binding domain-containing protein [Myxococcota bacterium]
MPSQDVKELTRLKDRAARRMAKGDWSGALDALLAARKLAPKDTFVARKVGDMCQRLGKKEGAVAAYRKAAALFAGAGFLFKAISVNKIILSIDPKDKGVQRTLAALYARREGPAATPAAAPARAPELVEIESLPMPAFEIDLDLARVDRDKLPWTPLFSDLDQNELDRVIEKLVPVNAAEGTVVCREGDPADSMYVISHGLVRVSGRDAAGTPVWLVNLREGEFFGEFGFFSDGKRHADVVAVEDCELLQIGRREIEEILTEFPRVRQVLEEFYNLRVVDTLLAKSKLFGSLAPEQRRDLLLEAALEVHATGSMIIQEGDDGESLYVIKSGEVEVYTALGQERIDLAVLGPGEIFGEISILTGTPTTANVVARTRTELVKFSRSEVTAMADKHPQLQHLLSETKDHRVHETIQRIQTEGFV